MNKKFPKLLIMFLGVPGSGKTYFAKQLAPEIGAVVFNSDATRVAIWGSHEAVHEDRQNDEDVARNNKMTFGAMDYMTAQTLRAGYSVIYDCNANKRSDRKSALAVELGAKFVLVRLQAPPEVALERIRTREETHDQMRMSDEDARAMLERFTRAIEEPSEKEFVIYINGEASFEEQYISFQQQVRPLIGG